MTLVVDASVACKWFFEEEGSDAARRLLARAAPRLAPDFLVAEVCNVAWKRAAAGEVSAAQARRIAEVLPGFLTRLVPSVTLAAAAVDCALEVGHPVYDCLYLALAEAEDVPLVTADERLWRRVQGTRWRRRVRILR